MIIIKEEMEELIALTMIKLITLAMIKLIALPMIKLIALAMIERLCVFFRKWDMKKLLHLHHLQQTLFLKWGT